MAADTTTRAEPEPEKPLRPVSEATDVELEEARREVARCWPKQDKWPR